MCVLKLGSTFGISLQTYLNISLPPSLNIAPSSSLSPVHTHTESPHLHRVQPLPLPTVRV